jgi:2-iminobutanoate/2-iminopropanoate deaminase
MKKTILILFVFTIFSCQKAEKFVVTTEGAPKAIGPYSQAIMLKNTLYSSGQIAITPDNGSLIKGSISDQIDQIMSNHLAILKSVKMDFSNVVKVTIYMTDLSNYKELNNAYSKYFKIAPPARETVEVSKLPANAEVEISLIAKRL